MANKKISELTVAGVLTGDEKLEVVQDGENRQTTAQEIADLGGGGGTWGSITGTLSDQIDLNTALGLKAPLASPTFTGSPVAPTQSPGDNSTKLSTTAYADAIAALKANLASPTFTGTPAAPTASFGTNTTQLATTAFVQAALVGLFDIRGDYDASVNAYPSSGGSGTAGAILKADAWVISVGGTLPTGQVVTAGDWIFAKVDTPGNTQSNWARIESNLTYVPVNKAGDTMSGALAMGSNGLTGLPAGTASGHALRYEQLITTPTVLTDGASVSWELNKLQFPEAKWTCATTTTTLSFTTSGNVNNGAVGILKFITNTASAITVTFPSGFTHKVGNVTFTTYTFPAATGKEYVLSFFVDGTTLNWVIPVEGIQFNRQASSYTLVLADAYKTVEMNNASANNLTVPLNSSVAYDIGTEILISQYGAGQTTIVATGGVTIRSKDGALKIVSQYSAACLVKVGTDEWYLWGDITT